MKTNSAYTARPLRPVPLLRTSSWRRPSILNRILSRAALSSRTVSTSDRPSDPGGSPLSSTTKGGLTANDLLTSSARRGRLPRCCDGDTAIEAVSDSGTGHRCASAVGEHRRVGRRGALCQPVTQFGGGVLPERDGTLLTAFAVQVHGCLSVHEYVANLQAGEFRHAGAGVVGGGE